MLIAYLRKIKCEKYFGRNSPAVKKVLLTKPRHLEFELHIMKSYHELVSALLTYEEHGHSIHATGKQVTRKTTLKHDLQILETGMLQPESASDESKAQEQTDEKTDEILLWLEGKSEPKKPAALAANTRMAITYRAERKKILKF